MVVLSILCEWVKVAASRQALVAIVLVAMSVRYTFAEVSSTAPPLHSWKGNEILESDLEGTS
eukprot:scaffold270_cov347-Pavlova_lutheri.AAC.8